MNSGDIGTAMFLNEAKLTISDFEEYLTPNLHSNGAGDLSDFEINKLILQKLGIEADCHISKERKTITRHCIDGSTLHQAYEINYCKSNDDVMPLAWEHKISTSWHCHVWNAKSRQVPNAYSSHVNPLRAVAECFLLIK